MITDSILKEAAGRVKPSAAEADNLKNTAREIIGRIDSEAARLGFNVHAIHVGSTARDTWLRGKRDIDIFLMFPPETPREQLKLEGLQLARSVSDDYEEKYAEHPYISAIYKGFDVDLVPCFNVPDASKIQSAVDRSPFHNQYVLTHINGLNDEARLLKQFMHGVGVYGSELRTQGFSGYLAELLIIRYGSFLDTVKAGANFYRGLVIDVEDHMDPGVKHPEPLIVIDPVDPKRNVAAALSEQKLYEFVDACRRFQKAPSLDMFFPPPVEPVDEPELLEIIDDRGTLLLTITFRAPDIVEDTLYPQLRKAEESVVRMLELHEFKVYRSGVWSNGKRCAIVLEMLVWSLPNIERHLGPPLEQREHADRFRDKYPDAYVFGYRYAVDIPRKYPRADELIRARLTSCALGKQVSESIRQDFIVLSGTSVLSVGEGIGEFLRELLHRK
ncbi:CCA tRNA nucleotidyltransferase [Methanocella arvoryzae]|uniref:CCA-adding enzyme n=1 Tax=Methanocella arvoryzae (strain DSM 22066 / NBRC 105507 / MRE50) TaxID=351160 RepID=Q0W552_METAR|nr:CCA tRNA nucleotidyltransferase [Methanocella arvoryzae]CAJ36491.1 tRNA nucleotidyltransferase (CCA-adding enzyme) [Methanocella arvoryzae MRE50]